MITVTTRVLEANGQILKPGTIVDSSGWLHEGKMLEQRRIRLATDAEKAVFYGEPVPESAAAPGTPKTTTAPAPARSRTGRNRTRKPTVRGATPA